MMSMKGFFDLEKAVPYKSEKGTHSCVSCGLYKHCQSPKIAPYGKCEKGILVVRDYPEEEDDREGIPFRGKAGKYLRRKLQFLGINLERDCLSTYAVSCRPTKNGTDRPPTEFEMMCCRLKIISTLIRHPQIKVVLLLGQHAVSSIVGYTWQKDIGSIAKWRGWTIPDEVFCAWLCPTFSPSYVIGQRDHPNEVEVLWMGDLERAIQKTEEDPPKYMPTKRNVTTYLDVGTVLTQIQKVSPHFLAFDLETTGLKPYREGHQIVSIGFSYEDGRAYAIPFPTEKRHLDQLTQILQDPRIGKIAANMKFEDTWLRVLHRISVNPFVHDTMIATHILDNRPGIKGLKFQAFVQFGVVGYDDDIAPYLKAPDANSLNQIMDVVADKTLFRKLLQYNGMDALLTYQLAMRQMGILGHDGGFKHG